mmetsp:Transcript_19886/g.27783  ORF Transcript_19886/g.27783 Transcript_19886/m.27783 type:complete len:215 (-) Transcript_19886:676-1320(-)
MAEVTAAYIREVLAKVLSAEILVMKKKTLATFQLEPPALEILTPTTALQTSVMEQETVFIKRILDVMMVITVLAMIHAMGQLVLEPISVHAPATETAMTKIAAPMTLATRLQELVTILQWLILSLVQMGNGATGLNSVFRELVQTWQNLLVMLRTLVTPFVMKHYNPVSRQMAPLVMMVSIVTELITATGMELVLPLKFRLAPTLFAIRNAMKM